MKKLLVVVDYQKDFVDGALGFDGAVDIESAVLDRIAAARASGCDVAFTFDTHNDDYLTTAEGKMLPIVHCIAGTPGHGLFGRVAATVLPQDRVYTKNTFGCDALYEDCKAAGYDTFELIGVVSNICVLTNAVLLRTACPDAKISVTAAATAAPDPQLHAAALAVLAGLGIEIMP
ncbi:MAG: cysteine hydrolase [Clostridia bacterium]|nr:cysteine hydrolase [Clostridia bacterium]